jgi:hypothetical protein
VDGVGSTLAENLCDGVQAGVQLQHVVIVHGRRCTIHEGAAGPILRKPQVTALKVTALRAVESSIPGSFAIAPRSVPGPSPNELQCCCQQQLLVRQSAARLVPVPVCA